MMELLSPAGSMDCLVAAVQNGADAVYFGGSILNARRFADNFAGDGLVSALDYCHERGVKAYITLNTLVFDRELLQALDFAGQLYRYGADAVLVQDLGLAALLRHHYPELTLHASTQMGIHDEGGLRYCESIGLRRAVLAREVSLNDIARLHRVSGIELEAFGHGALCMSFSGSCLYSSMAGERSGNRGTCAQPCRKEASVSGVPSCNDYCLSPNDICMIEHLSELEKAGVCCIKLEGRMKKPEYVAAVTRCYRSALDGAGREEIAEMKNEMFRFFNRGEFSTSHFFTDTVRTDRVGSSKPTNVDVSAAKGSFSSQSRKRPVSFDFRMRVGEPSTLAASCAGKTVTVSGDAPVQAAKPQNEAVYADRLSKLGDTPFRLENCIIDMDKSCYLSSASVNAIRRSAADELARSFRVRNEMPKETVSFEKAQAEPIRKENAFKLVYALVSSFEEARIAFECGAELVGMDPFACSASEHEALAKYRQSGKKLVLVLPNALISHVQREQIRELLSSGLFDGAEANNIGQVELISGMDIRIAGIGLNALNTYTVSELIRLGFTYVIPSVELTSAQLKALTDEYAGKLILWTHGRVPLMQLLHCPVKEHLGCRNCRQNAGSVTDGSGRVFPLTNIRFKDQCLVRMLNCSTTDLIDITDKLPEAAGLRLGFLQEGSGSVKERLNALHSALSGVKTEQYPGSTRGHFNRKVD